MKIDKRIWKIFRIVVIVAICVVVCTAGVVVAKYIQQQRVGGLYESAFEKITLGMSRVDVEKLMDKPEFEEKWTGGQRFPKYWGDSDAPETLPAVIFRQCWSAPDFFLGRMWEVGYDENNRVVSKHCYD